MAKKRKNVGGRPRKLSYTKGARIVKHRRSGASLKDCAHLEGIHYSTLLDWLKRGERAQEKGTGSERVYARFSELMKRAWSEHEQEFRGYLQTAALMGDSKATAIVLERKHGESWGKRVEHVAGGPPSVEEQAQVGVLADRARMADLAQHPEARKAMATLAYIQAGIEPELLPGEVEEDEQEAQTNEDET